MGGAERVVDVDVAVRRERLRERRVVGLLRGVEAEVLEQEHLARLEPAEGVLGADAERVAGAGHADARAARDSRCATGRSRADSMTLPLGRPRWLMRMTMAPRFERGTRWSGWPPGCGCRP